MGRAYLSTSKQLTGNASGAHLCRRHRLLLINKTYFSQVGTSEERIIEQFDRTGIFTLKQETRVS